MPAYEYTAMDESGKRISGFMNSETMDQAVQQLQQNYQVVVRVQPSRQKARNDQKGAWERVDELITEFKQRVPHKRISFFTRQLSTMFTAGMTLERAIGSLARKEKNKRFKTVLEQIQKDINSGISFSDAAARHPGAFSPLFVALIKAGEISGKLGEILDRLADHAEKTEDTRRKIFSAMSYPAVVSIILCGAVVVLLGFVAPKFHGIYRNFGATLPLPTQILLDTSHVIASNMASFFLLSILLFIGVVLFFLTSSGRKIWDRFVLNMPVFGSLITSSIMSRLSRTFGLLMSTSVPVLDSFTLASRVTSNKIIEDAVLAARESTKAGRTIHDSLAAEQEFPDILLQLVQTGEETGALDQLFLKIAEYYEKEMDALISRLTSILEPLLIVILGVVVGGLVILIYLPIFTLGSAMRQGM